MSGIKSSPSKNPNGFRFLCPSLRALADDHRSVPTHRATFATTALRLMIRFTMTQGRRSEPDRPTRANLGLEATIPMGLPGARVCDPQQVRSATLR